MPPRSSFHPGLPLLALASALALPSCRDAVADAPSAPPVVAALARHELAPRVRGLVLRDELGCVACHADAADAPPAPGPRGPDLASVAARVRPAYLAAFLAAPHAVEPGTPMPDLLHGLATRDRAEAAANLAAYLQSFGAEAVTASAPTPTADAAALAEGRTLFHEVGCAACHAPRGADGGELPLPGSTPMAPLVAKYTHGSLVAFLQAPHTARPARRMPDLRLAPAEADALAHYLLAASADEATTNRAAAAAPNATPNATSNAGAAASSASRPSATAPDPARVAAGRAEFAARGCVHCHPLADPLRAASPAAKPLAALDATRGCLSGNAGAWPHYALTDAQRADLAAALAAPSTPPAADEPLQRLLVGRDCTACHTRDDWAKLADARQPFFVSADQSLGQDGRLPPTLTGVGAKLQTGWLRDAIAHGQAERPYLRARMPGFGPQLADDLAARLAANDTLPPIPLLPPPAEGDPQREERELGRTLVGDKAMNCITCHTFAGERAGSMAAIDLVATTGQRLRPEWFAHFLRDPVRFRPDTLMPRFFVDGTSTRPEHADGNVDRQIAAMWRYLAEGRNVGKPSGIRRAPIELEVGDEAVLLRRTAPHTGKRAISVGLPGGVNFTFDAERLALNQLWRGRFVDAAPVWTSQGSGEVRLLGDGRQQLPAGPVFATLADPDAPWPTADRRELGDRWLGYDLDAQQRPTFRYTCGAVAITDAPVERPQAPGSDQPPGLRRTLTFAAEQSTTLQFRAAVAARIDELGAGRVQVGDGLELQLPVGSYRVLDRDGGRELRVAIPVPTTGASLTIDYTLRGGGK
jgi:mono/diheme cytochrome c family protein